MDEDEGALKNWHPELAIVNALIPVLTDRPGLSFLLVLKFRLKCLPFPPGPNLDGAFSRTSCHVGMHLSLLWVWAICFLNSVMWS